MSNYQKKMKYETERMKTNNRNRKEKGMRFIRFFIKSYMLLNFIIEIKTEELFNPCNNECQKHMCNGPTHIECLKCENSNMVIDEDYGYCKCAPEFFDEPGNNIRCQKHISKCIESMINESGEVVCKKCISER